MYRQVRNHAKTEARDGWVEPNPLRWLRDLGVFSTGCNTIITPMVYEMMRLNSHNTARYHAMDTYPQFKVILHNVLHKSIQDLTEIVIHIDGVSLDNTDPDHDATTLIFKYLAKQKYGKCLKKVLIWIEECFRQERTRAYEEGEELDMHSSEYSVNDRGDPTCSRDARVKEFPESDDEEDLQEETHTDAILDSLRTGMEAADMDDVFDARMDEALYVDDEEDDVVNRMLAGEELFDQGLAEESSDVEEHNFGEDNSGNSD
ncbi:hypothetical protein BDZ45DRAFT_750044 [Acephala macrosclerotiorum]|nr:hypothetical protein BDZ45DRAFT_750044 [Acephala macrosclerotiorum]